MIIVSRLREGNLGIGDVHKLLAAVRPPVPRGRELDVQYEVEELDDDDPIGHL